MSKRIHRHAAPTCTCSRWHFPHKRSYDCAEPEPNDEIADQQAREWAADRAADAAAINERGW